MTPANPNVVYAQIETAADREEALSDEEREEWDRLDDVDSLPPDPEWNGIWRSTDKGVTWEFRGNQNGRPMYEPDADDYEVRSVHALKPARPSGCRGRCARATDWPGRRR